MLVFPQIYGSSQSDSDYIFSFDESGRFQYPETVTIPDTVTTLAGDTRSFMNHTEIKHIVFEGSDYSTIGVSTFDGCVNLEDITNISKTISSIGNYAFRNCYSLKSLEIGNVATLGIGTQAFQACSSLSSFDMPNSETKLTLGSGAFQTCTSLPEETVEDILSHPMATVSAYIFSGCTQLKELTIKGTAANMFQNCTGLETVTVTGTFFSAGNLGGAAFYGCTGLKSLNITSENIKTIDDNYCGNCTSLVSVSLPDSITSIGTNAFLNCSALPEITIGNSASLIVGAYAFKDCTSLKAVSFKNSETSLNIGAQAFINCKSLTDEAVETILNQPVTNAGSAIFHSCTGLKELTVPFTAGNMFQNCTGLETVTITGALSTGNLGGQVFTGCTSLKTLKITGTAAKTLDTYFCQNCSALTTVELPESITTVNTYAFQNCTSLEAITLPASITSFAVNVFTGCTKLTDIKLGTGWSCAANFSTATALTADSMEAMFESLADLTGSTKKTLTLGSSNLAKLTSEQKAIATGKNWTLA